MRQLTTIDELLAARDAWARKLPEAVLRSLAYDYRQGNTLDQACLDAWIELDRRILHGQLRGAKRCEEHLKSPGRAATRCPACQSARRRYAYSSGHQDAISPSAS